MTGTNRHTSGTVMGKIAFIGLLLVAAIIVVTGIMSRQANSEQVAEWTKRFGGDPDAS